MNSKTLTGWVRQSDLVRPLHASHGGTTDGIIHFQCHCHRSPPLSTTSSLIITTAGASYTSPRANCSTAWPNVPHCQSHAQRPPRLTVSCYPRPSKRNDPQHRTSRVHACWRCSRHLINPHRLAGNPTNTSANGRSIINRISGTRVSTGTLWDRLSSSLAPRAAIPTRPYPKTRVRTRHTCPCLMRATNLSSHLPRRPSVRLLERCRRVGMELLVPKLICVQMGHVA